MLLNLLLACHISSQTSKYYTLIGLLERGELLDLRISQSNYGLLKDQGHLRLNLWLPFQPPISLGLHSLPVQTQFNEDSIFIDHAEFSITKGTVNMRGDDHGMSLHLKNGSHWKQKTPAPVWSDILIQGWVTSGKRSLPISGAGILLYHEEPLSDYLSTERTTLWIEGSKDTSSIYVEHTSSSDGESCLLWREKDVAAQSCSISINEKILSLKTPSLEEEINILRKIGTEHPHELLSPPERWLSSPHSRHIYTAEMSSRRVLWIHRGTEPILSDLLPSPSERSQKRRQNPSGEKKKGAQQNIK